MLHLGSTRLLTAIVGSVLLCALTACGGGVSGSESGDGNNAALAGSPPAAPVLSLAFSVKQMHFSWNAVSDATYYKIYQNPDGASGFTQVDGNITATSHDRDIAVHRLNWSAARYLLEACNAAGCTASNEVNTRGAVLQAIGYFKASNTEANDNFAISLALSSDGNTLAVGAAGKDAGAGAVYIFTRQGGAWSQQTYVTASNTSAGDAFGISVSLSSDGNTLAVGANFEDSLGTGIDGSQGSIAENSSNRGAVYVFTRRGGNWSQQAYVKSSSSHDNAYFGGAVSLNSDGNTLAVGAIGERTGALDAGAVYVFTRSASVWSQQAFVKASNIQTNAHFGASVALNSDGNTLAVGAHGESSGATGIHGNQSDNITNNAGAVYVFTRSASAWSQQAYVKASNTAAGDAFGASVALSSDGNTLAVGAGAEASAASGIDGDQTDDSTGNAGAVYVFTRRTNIWSQQAYVKASNTGGNDYFGGTSVALSRDGNLLAVGAIGEDSAVTGIGGDQTNRSSGYSGAVYFFARSAGTWSQQSYVKASNTGAGDTFGRSLGLSSDGNLLAVGAPGESSGAIGVGGNQTDNNTTGAGAIYLY
ncbi:MAG: hypothetical protein Q7J84_05045 [Sulfuricaulis sp.]|nr:hypothetical protein [Sulfuricaulis sp.]